MKKNISEKIHWLKSHPRILDGIFRGIERETLRVQPNGLFSNQKHPYCLGSPLTHKWITTDFAENLLEFVTPVYNNVDNLLSFLQDLHSFTAYKIQNERMWPFSMPYTYNKKTKINIARYGISKLGKMKTIYRKGLKVRYGELTNTITGIHYNFSLPKIFWKYHNKKKDYVSSGYLHLIRNYYRFGWIIPYLFGASPAIPFHFLKNKNTKHSFLKNQENISYLPWATSLRISNIGYTNTKISDLKIMFNEMNSYVYSLKKALNTPSKEFHKIGLKDKYGNYQQLNTNILQTESELYTQIRPKTKILNGETLLKALKNRGIEYVEIRSLDNNPFTPLGIDKNQILILDLFLVWCSLLDSPKMYKKDFLEASKNWEKIIFEGRKPHQTIYLESTQKNVTLIEIGHIIFKDLKKIAFILDKHTNSFVYQKACHNILSFFQHPELTYSAQCLNILLKEGIKQSGLKLSYKYHKQFIQQYDSNKHKNYFKKESILSHCKQTEIEKKDKLSFNTDDLNI